MFRCLCLEWILVVLFEGFLALGAKTLVRGTVGQNITLPCDYSTERHGITTTCWGRGACPRFSCADAIVWTDGQQVTSRRSSVYQLMGNIPQGDVALTIENVTESATGTYCCRVEIKGWNNDQKTHVEVLIEKGNSEPIKEGVTEQRKLETSSGLYIGLGTAAVLLFIISGVILLLLKWYLSKNQKIIIFTRQTESSETGGIQHTLESRVRVQENIYEES